MMNIQTIIIPAEFDLDDLDLDDEIGLQPNKRPISTIDKNIKRQMYSLSQLYMSLAI